MEENRRKTVLTRRAILLGALAILGTAVAFAATPPAQVNYQGVLRDASDKPLTGAYDMVFSFWDSAVAGNEILDDSHLASGTGAVSVSNGLFNVALGSGAVTDGPGSGTYASLDQVFRDYPAVWLQVQIGTEILSPRTRLIAAAYALNTTNLNGMPSSSFLDVTAAAQTKGGSVTFDTGAGGSTPAVTGKGRLLGGTFSSYLGSGQASLANDDDGVDASGINIGVNGTASSEGWGVYGTGYYGVNGQGSSIGVNGSGPTGVSGSGTTYGVYGSGLIGVYGTSSSGAVPTGVRGVGNGSSATGVSGQGGQFGVTGTGPTGVFGSGTAIGVEGHGTVSNGGEAGYFKDSGYSGQAELGDGDIGVIGSGNYMGGKYTQGTASGVEADLCFNSTAVVGYAHNSGENPAWFQDYSAGSYAAVGKGGYKIAGSGAVSFIQNDPTDSRRQIVYTAPEGDEVAVYTRGEAKLINGEAHVALGSTFQWVANPDIGLTATATPRGELVPIEVESVSPEELVVKGPAGSTAAFDFMVWGLRIGFEDRPVVQPKEHESPIPNLSQDAAILVSHPELKTFTASSRHAAMRRLADPVAPAAPDLSRSTALKAAIGIWDPAKDAPRVDHSRVTVADPETLPKGSGLAPASQAPPAPLRGAVAAPANPASAPLPSAPSAAAPAATASAPPPGPVWTWPVSEAVEAGDLLVLDPARPGQLLRAAFPSDPNVVGVAAADSSDSGGSLRVVLVDTFYARVKADATSEPIRPGDLLVSSAIPGHVMRAPGGAVPSTLVGRAMEGLDAGTGTIAISRTGR
jgi:hypothetical protein